MATLPHADGGRENQERLRAILRHCAVVPRRNPRGSELETSALPTGSTGTLPFRNEGSPCFSDDLSSTSSVRKL